MPAEMCTTAKAGATAEMSATAEVGAAREVTSCVAPACKYGLGREQQGSGDGCNPEHAHQSLLPGTNAIK